MERPAAVQSGREAAAAGAAGSSASSWSPPRARTARNLRRLPLVEPARSRSRFPPAIACISATAWSAWIAAWSSAIASTAAGLPDEWSAWTDRDLFIRAITPGDYLLQVEARTRSGRAAAPTSYRYRILPRWHERWWVRVLGVLALLGVVGAAGAGIRAPAHRSATSRPTASSRRASASARTSWKQVNRKLAELATEDALTGVSNRRALENGLQREWYRCLDQRRPLSVLMIDVDHFKRYNDAHGHLEGDVLLRTIAQQLYALHDPKRELLARYGGEEFALLLPGVHQDEALRRAREDPRWRCRSTSATPRSASAWPASCRPCRAIR